MLTLSLPTKILILLALMALSAFGGWHLADNHRDAQQLESERQDAALYRAGTQHLLALNQDIGRDLAEARQTAAAERRDFDRRKSNAAPLAICEQSQGLRLPGDRAADPVRLTADFGRLWNDALNIGLPADLRAGRADGPDPWADPAATVTPEDALDNHADNAEQCNGIREIALKFQRWARGVGAAP